MNQLIKKISGHNKTSSDLNINKGKNKAISSDLIFKSNVSNISTNSISNSVTSSYSLISKTKVINGKGFEKTPHNKLFLNKFYNRNLNKESEVNSAEIDSRGEVSTNNLTENVQCFVDEINDKNNNNINNTNSSYFGGMNSNKHASTFTTRNLYHFNCIPMVTINIKKTNEELETEKFSKINKRSFVNNNSYNGYNNSLNSNSCHKKDHLNKSNKKNMNSNTSSNNNSSRKLIIKNTEESSSKKNIVNNGISKEKALRVKQEERKGSNKRLFNQNENTQANPTISKRPKIINYIKNSNKNRSSKISKKKLIVKENNASYSNNNNSKIKKGLIEEIEPNNTRTKEKNVLILKNIAIPSYCKRTRSPFQNKIIDNNTNTNMKINKKLSLLNNCIDNTTIGINIIDNTIKNDDNQKLSKKENLNEKKMQKRKFRLSSNKNDNNNNNNKNNKENYNFLDIEENTSNKIMEENKYMTVKKIAPIINKVLSFRAENNQKFLTYKNNVMNNNYPINNSKKIMNNKSEAILKNSTQKNILTENMIKNTVYQEKEKEKKDSFICISNKKNIQNKTSPPEEKFYVNKISIIYNNENFHENRRKLFTNNKIDGNEKKEIKKEKEIIVNQIKKNNNNPERDENNNNKKDNIDIDEEEDIIIPEYSSLSESVEINKENQNLSKPIIKSYKSSTSRTFNKKYFIKKGFSYILFLDMPIIEEIIKFCDICSLCRLTLLNKNFHNCFKFFINNKIKKKVLFLNKEGKVSTIKKSLMNYSSLSKLQPSILKSKYMDFLYEKKNKYDNDIKKDLTRTFPENSSFKYGCINYNKLYHILTAYSNYNKNIGYAQGINFLVANIIYLFEKEEEGFIFLDAMIQKFKLENLFGVNNKLNIILDSVDDYIKKNCPSIKRYLDTMNLNSEFFTANWMVTLFSSSMDSKYLFCVWDFMIIFGWKFFKCFIVAILTVYEKKILEAKQNKLTILMRNILKNEEFKLQFENIINKSFNFINKITSIDS